ncbi:MULTISPECIES: A/G-specific adenine glycosylase [Ramlibacter]|uniref:Adenine DNA glycosylase n=1 Tax=Ramlibacter pinisoli TaxID=2682844 RepID=A0A6N8IVN0_9BURK|nr:MULTISPECIES: A/G-specific adenine glycosylase [Ramlibacter]MBA2965048.1 A/G-specific adenine glycosylase [Ramlibacter sp. CGMCC 1.13660]MVQ30013.1 A/G-specific adenine glycosylase [Ramlibacter pinisoli]
MSAVPGDIAGRVVRWQRSHGRQGLPWQDTRDPYRVWLSEIMLQQTQVAVVLGYYERFLLRFPDVRALAAAPLDDVLGLWSGLGYYSRARNLHRCAQQVVEQHGGRFPASAAALDTLPGIGRSTAAAIAAFCFGERVAILDGNVKRVLARALAFGDDLAAGAAQRALWDRAGELVPRDGADMPAYTQGLMDLGATVCLVREPSCLLCPLESECLARREGRPDSYPVRTRKLRRTAQSLWLLQAQASDGSVWLEKRPVPGVWAGLYCLPLFDSREELAQTLPARARAGLQDEPPVLHVLTHKDLHLHPVRAALPARPLPGREGRWFARNDWEALGLPAPVRRLLAAGGD